MAGPRQIGAAWKGERPLAPMTTIIIVGQHQPRQIGPQTPPLPRPRSCQPPAAMPASGAVWCLGGVAVRWTAKRALVAVLTTLARVVAGSKRAVALLFAAGIAAYTSRITMMVWCG